MRILKRNFITFLTFHWLIKLIIYRSNVPKTYMVRWFKESISRKLPKIQVIRKSFSLGNPQFAIIKILKILKKGSENFIMQSIKWGFEKNLKRISKFDIKIHERVVHGFLDFFNEISWLNGKITLESSNLERSIWIWKELFENGNNWEIPS